VQSIRQQMVDAVLLYAEKISEGDDAGADLTKEETIELKNVLEACGLLDVEKGMGFTAIVTDGDTWFEVPTEGGLSICLYTKEQMEKIMNDIKPRDLDPVHELCLFSATEA